jgi:excisionase family DNA binding protein
MSTAPSLPDSDVMTSAEAMAYLRMSKPSFYRALYEGKLPAFKVGNLWRFRRSTLDAWIAKQEELNQWRVETA